MSSDIIERARSLDWETLERLASAQREAQHVDGPDYLSGRAKLIELRERHEVMSETAEALSEAALYVEPDEQLTPVMIGRVLGRARAAVRWSVLARDNRRLLTAEEYEILTRAWRTVVGEP